MAFAISVLRVRRKSSNISTLREIVTVPKTPGSLRDHTEAKDHQPTHFNVFVRENQTRLGEFNIKISARDDVEVVPEVVVHDGDPGVLSQD
jgi:hypothetical protein